MVYNWAGMAYRQLFVHSPYPDTDCTSKTIIVTGSNTGLGKEAVRHFVRLNASRTLPRIDAVIENAAIATRQYTLIADNESTITVNVVSTFLLALPLLPLLRQSAERPNITLRLTIVSSEMHFLTTLPERKTPNIFNTLNDPQTKTMPERYSTSKLLDTLICRELCRLQPITSTKVVLNPLCPGFCHSELAREIGDDWSMRIMKKTLAKSTEEGSRTLVHAGVAAGAETHGMLLSQCRIKRRVPLVEGEEGLELQGRVWAELREKLEGMRRGLRRVFERALGGSV